MIPIHPAGPADSGGEAGDGPQFVSMYEKQPEIYPRAVSGWFATWRWTFVWLTQIVFYGLAWLQWGGRQAVLFDLEAQRFFILGLVLYPQDLIYLAGLLVIPGPRRPGSPIQVSIASHPVGTAPLQRVLREGFYPVHLRSGDTAGTYFIVVRRGLAAVLSTPFDR